MGIPRGFVFIAALILVGAVGIVAYHLTGRTAPPAPDETPEPVVVEAPGEPKAPDLLPAIAEPEPEAPEPTRDIRVYGTVLDAVEGTPIADARIFPVTQLLTYDDPEGALGRGDGPVAQTNDSGAYELEVSEGSWRHLICLAEGYARAIHPYQPREGGSVRVDFLMEPGATVSGRVVDSRSGAGIEDAMVVALGAQHTLVDMMRSQGEEGIYQAYADEDGAYRIEGLPVGAYRVSVQARQQGYIFSAEKAVALDIRAGRDYDDIDFRLEPGAVIEGRVVGPNHEPIPRASVTVVPGQLFQTVLDTIDTLDPSSLVVLNARTDDEGRFRIAGLDYDWPFRLRTDAGGFAEASSDTLRIQPGESPRQITLTLSRGSRIAGVARFEDGEPAAEHQIRLMPDIGALTSGRAASFRSTATDGQGRFEFETVAAGNYGLSAAGRGAMAAAFGDMAGGHRIEVDGASPVEGIELTVRHAEEAEPEETMGDGVIDGVVLDADGQPAPSVRVEARLSANPSVTTGATTDTDGTFQVTRLLGALYDLSVVSDAGVGEARNVAAGSTVTINLDPPAHIRGVVVDRQGEPAPSTRVTLERQDSERAAQPMAVLMRNVLGDDIGGQTTTPAGFFEFRNVTPGQYVIKARSSALGTGASQTVTLARGQSIDDIRIILDGGVRFGGTVVDSGGTPIAGVTVRLMPAATSDTEDFMSLLLPAGMQRTAGTAVSDANGRFELDQTPPGTYTLVATHGSYARFHQPALTVPPGRDTLNHRIVMGQGADISGAYEVDGEPREGVVVQMLGPSGLHMLTTDRNGQVDFRGIPEGSYLVSTIDPSGASPAELLGLSMTPQVIDIRDGDRSHIDLGPREGGTVSGYISGLDPGGIITVSLRSPGGPDPESINLMNINALIDASRYLAGQTLVRADGQFVIEGIEPGTYIMEVMSLDIDLNNPDIGRLLAMDRTPHYRQEITVGDEHLDLNINIPGQP